MLEPPPQRRSSRVPTKRKRLAEPLSDDDSSDVDLDFKKSIMQKVINLSSKGLVDDDLDVLYQVIEQSTILEKLDVGVNHLTLADGKLANAIAKNKTLKVLWLSDNNINIQGARHLANALRQNNTPLKNLDLAGNSIGDEGAQYIADMLAVSKSLQKIYLGQNKISDSGAQSIATSLTKNTVIREIYLDWNNITDMGVQKLADALESNHNIRTLDSSHNRKISKDVRGRINAILKRKMLIANKMNNTDQVVTIVPPSDKSSSSSIGMKPTPEQQHKQMMDASQKAKQSSASSSSLTRGSISDEKMPASNKRGTAKSTTDDGLVVTQGPITSRKLEVAKGMEDAKLYLDQVKTELSDRPHIYNEFIEILKEFKAEKVDAIGLSDRVIGVSNRVCRLFHGHNELILGFNIYLPDGYKIYKPPSSQQQQHYQPPSNWGQPQPPPPLWGHPPPPNIHGEWPPPPPPPPPPHWNDLSSSTSVKEVVGEVLISYPMINKVKLNFEELVKQKTIDLRNNNLRDDDLDVLMKVIKQSTVLEDLDLECNNLTLVDGKLANAIAKNTTIKELWLNRNNISLQGVKHLADALKKNNTLQHLYLNDIKISDEGAKYLADMLATNKTLQKISLRDNNIGDKGAQSIAASLLVNTGIRSIDLGWNMIKDMGARKMAYALESNHSIKNLNLYCNLISKDVMDRIKALTLLDLKTKMLIANKVNDTTKRDEQNELNQSKSPNKRRTQTPITKDEEITLLRAKLQALEGKNELNTDTRPHTEKIMTELNSVRKEKEAALKLVASMKADITRKEEEIEKKEQKIISRDTDIANKDQQFKSALQDIAKRDEDLANKNKQLEQLHSIKRILPFTTDGVGETATKRTRTESMPKELILKLGYEHTHCSICASKLSADLGSKDENIRKHLPVLSSSKTCDHYFCHGCILKRQAAIAEKRQAPKWLQCMECRTKTAFCPSEPKYHRLLIDILKKAEWADAPKVKEELVE